MSYQTKTLDFVTTHHLAQVIRSNLSRAGLHWATNFFFLHSIRGVKHSTQHVADPECSGDALKTLLREYRLSQSSLARGDWWIDVGMEFHNPDELCLQWETVSHTPVVASVLRISDDNASRITSFGSSKYCRDISSHLMAISGCRIEPGIRAQGDFEAVYLQMYTTDKALTYNLDGRNHGKTLKMKDAMGPEQPSPFMKGLRNVFVEAMTKNTSNARIEVRVPIKYANSALTGLDQSVIRSSLLGFRRQNWWLVFSPAPRKNKIANTVLGFSA